MKHSKNIVKHHEILEHMLFDAATPALGVVISAPGAEFLAISAIPVLV